jgi:hypothetical protein
VKTLLLGIVGVEGVSDELENGIPVSVHDGVRKKEEDLSVSWARES